MIDDMPRFRTPSGAPVCESYRSLTPTFIALSISLPAISPASARCPCRANPITVWKTVVGQTSPRQKPSLLYASAERTTDGIGSGVAQSFVISACAIRAACLLVTAGPCTGTMPPTVAGRIFSIVPRRTAKKHPASSSHMCRRIAAIPFFKIGLRRAASAWSPTASASSIMRCSLSSR